MFSLVQLCPEKRHIAVVISPLKIMMLNQVDILSKKGVKYASLSGLSEEDKLGMSKTLCCRFLKYVLCIRQQLIDSL